MFVQYVNKRGQTYYLHQGITKTGKPKYFFSMKSKGTPVDTIPDGFEIYENPDAQVFLRRIQPKIITDNEIAIIEKEMKQSPPITVFSDRREEEHHHCVCSGPGC